MKQTAVEWLEYQLSEGTMPIKEAFNQAKEMEKERIIDFARLCLNKAKDLDILTSFMDAEQYYKQTFKSE